MEARHLINSASFGPETLRVIGRAFDEVWASIEGSIGCDQQREAARLKLANALLSVASDDSRDVEVLKKAALKEMAGDCRWQPMQSPMRH
jgi:hypothetical protein